MKIEGRNAVFEALVAGTPLDKILASNNSNDLKFNEIINLAKSKKIQIKFVSGDILNKESATSHHQGIIAYASELVYSTIDEIIEFAKSKNEKPFIVILDGIEDPHNFGSIIRVAECMGVHGIIFGKNRACQITETVIKTSAGAINHMKLARVTNINTEIEKLKEKNIWVFALELGGDNLSNFTAPDSVAIVIGSEGNGVSHLTKKLCDGVVSIEMKGKVNSLNASVATGIALYEISKKR